MRTDLERPGFLLPREVAAIRYALGLGRLTAFQPGAAARGKPSGREDVDAGAEVAPIRLALVEALEAPLRLERDPHRRLHRALAAVKELWPEVAGTRRRLLEHHANELSESDLDDEVGRRVLVSVAGGGGGAGFVYIGAYEALERAGIVPGYVIGSSIGALLGVFRARSAAADWSEYATLAGSLELGKIFTPPGITRRYGLPGLLRLRLRSSIAALFARPDGSPGTLGDLPIPYEAVVAGVRRRSFDQLPLAFLKPFTAAEASAPGRLAQLMWQVGAFFDPRIVKPVVLGADAETSAFDAVDAVGFSAAIPGVLHYDVDAEDARMDALVAALCDREDIAAIVDGGVASNVPVELAWRRVQAGKLGTRNVVYLAFDCFHPQWDPKHLWLQPITQAVQLQMMREAPYAHWIVRFEPTLSPLTLLPDRRALDAAIGWGREAIEASLPLVRRLLEPVSWEARGP